MQALVVQIINADVLWSLNGFAKEGRDVGREREHGSHRGQELDLH